MTIDIEEHGPDAMTPGDWRKLLAMLERAEVAQRNAEQVCAVLGEDVVEVIMLARQADGQSLTVVQ